MMRINQETYDQLVIRAHVGAVPKGTTSVSEIASQLKMPRQKVQKLAHRLAVAGFLQSTRGRNGGVRLAVPPSELVIGKLLVALQKPELDTGTAAGGDRQGGDEMASMLQSAFGALEAALNYHTLADLTFATPRCRHS